MVTREIKRHVKLGFSHLDTAEIVAHLNKLLANYQIHRQKVMAYKWNIKGRDIIIMKDKFDQLDKSNSENINKIAERIRVFGSVPLSTYTEYLDISEISEMKMGISGYEMVTEIIDDYEILVSLMMNVNDSANKIGDSGTFNMINEILYDLEREFWMLNEWTK